MELGSKDIAISFQMMVTHIKLAVNIQHIRTMRAQTLQELYDAEIAPLQIKPSYRTFQHWHTTGTKFAALAGGGTVYFLVLVAGLGLRTSLASMPGDLACHLGNALRHPDPDTMIGRTIIDKIIPVIHMLRGMFPITIDPLFPSAILTSHNLPSLIDCADIATSDLFFDSFIFKLVERSNSPWYNQQATRGLNAPTHVQPYMLEKDDIRFNYTQLVPYISSEAVRSH
ncbi:hypothetical protein P692DRAFT_201866827 [Suillus brevipes Sb2]|nr:hypothetical protein P692DRAFT_201866827 [Suillus brevipes Sb2]